MIYQAFIDDSSQDDDIFVLAGHVASIETWAKFSIEWESIIGLSTRNKDGVLRFKMRDMPLTSDGMWAVRAFNNILKKYEILTVASAVHKADIRAAQDRTWAPFAFDNAPYMNNVFILLRNLLVDAIHQQRKDLTRFLPENAEVRFIFDEQREAEIVRLGWGDFLAARPSEMARLYGTVPRFEKEERFPPLQAADLWAWFIREHISPFKDRSTKERALISKFIIDELVNTTRQIIIFVASQDDLLRNFANSFSYKPIYNIVMRISFSGFER